jgi:RimJ/RimL family protein N-acetyltransferase
MTAATTTGTIRLRPLRHGETEPVDTVFAGMSSQSRHLRFHGPRPRLTDAMRRMLTDVDGRRHVALVAEVVEGDDVAPIGIGHLIALDETTAEVAFSVVDAWHGNGVGRRLLTALRHRAVDLGYARLRAYVMVGNLAASRLLSSVLPEGFARRVGMAHEFTAPLPSRINTPSVLLAV